MCPAQVEEGIIHFASRGAMNIMGLGPRIVKQLIDKKFVNDVADLYHLTNEQLSQLDHFKDKSITNLLTSIENSKQNSAELLLFGLGIDHVGAKAARLILEKYKNLEKVSQLTVPELISIDTIGETIAESLTAYFNQPSAQKLLQELRDSGLNMEYLGTVEEEAPDNFFKEKTVVLTGKLSDFTQVNLLRNFKILELK